MNPITLHLSSGEKLHDHYNTLKNCNLEGLIYSYTNGNMGCSCNLQMGLDRQNGLEDKDDYECDNGLKVIKITADLPHDSGLILWQAS